MSLIVQIDFPVEDRIDSYAFTPVAPARDGDFGLRQCVDHVVAISHKNFVHAKFMNDETLLGDYLVFGGQFLRTMEPALAYLSMLNDIEPDINDIPF